MVHFYHCLHFILTPCYLCADPIQAAGINFINGVVFDIGIVALGSGVGWPGWCCLGESGSGHSRG
jgi:hypothetical protein